MPRFVLKTAVDKDEYVLWSTIVDNAVSPVLTRDKMAERLLREAIEEAKKSIEKQLTEARIARYGETFLVTNVGDDDFDGFYDLDAVNLAEFVRAQRTGDVETLNRVLTEIKDDE